MFFDFCLKDIVTVVYESPFTYECNILIDPPPKKLEKITWIVIYKATHLSHLVDAFKNGSFFFFDSSENQTNKTVDASVNKKAADSTSQVRLSFCFKLKF